MKCYTTDTAYCVDKYHMFSVINNDKICIDDFTENVVPEIRAYLTYITRLVLHDFIERDKFNTNGAI